MQAAFKGFVNYISFMYGTMLAVGKAATFPREFNPIGHDMPQIYISNDRLGLLIG
jgi:hypothetical protein